MHDTEVRRNEAQSCLERHGWIEQDSDSRSIFALRGGHIWWWKAGRAYCRLLSSVASLGMRRAFRQRRGRSGSHLHIPIAEALVLQLEICAGSIYAGQNAVQPVEHLFWHAGHAVLLQVRFEVGELRSG